MLNTVTDFWEMVWQEEVPLIVMITKLQERKEVWLSLPIPRPSTPSKGWGGVITSAKGYARPNEGSEHPLAFSALLSEGTTDRSHSEKESPRAAALAPSGKASPPHVASRALVTLCQLDNRIKRLGQLLGEGAEAAVSSVPPVLSSSPPGRAALLLGWELSAGGSRLGQELAALCPCGSHPVPWLGSLAPHSRNTSLGQLTLSFLATSFLLSLPGSHSIPVPSTSQAGSSWVWQDMDWPTHSSWGAWGLPGV